MAVKGQIVQDINETFISSYKLQMVKRSTIQQIPEKNKGNKR